MPVLYEDKLYRVTDSLFESDATSYRISSITSIVGPLHESMDFFGGLLLNAGRAIVGLIGLLSLHAILCLLDQAQPPWAVSTCGASSTDRGGYG